MYVPLPFCPGSAFLPPALTMFILCHRTKQDLTQLKSLTRATTCRSNSAARLGLSRSRTLSVPAPRSAPSLPLMTFPEFVRRSTLKRRGGGGGSNSLEEEASHCSIWRNWWRSCRGCWVPILGNRLGKTSVWMKQWGCWGYSNST